MAMDTGILGGVTATPEDLAAMQKGQYILHARGGKLTKVPVEKIALPLDPQGHVQRLCLVGAPDGTGYTSFLRHLGASVAGGVNEESDTHGPKRRIHLLARHGRL